MHELSIAEDLIASILDIAKKNSAKKVTRATLEIGALSGIDPEALKLAYEVLSRSTLAEESALEIEYKPLTVCCPNCNWQGEADKFTPLCGGCGQLSVSVSGGRQMRLLSIDVD